MKIIKRKDWFCSDSIKFVSGEKYISFYGKVVYNHKYSCWHGCIMKQNTSLQYSIYGNSVGRFDKAIDAMKAVEKEYKKIYKISGKQLI